MPSWQSVKPAREHVKVGTCWCGYITGRIGRLAQPTAGLYGRGVLQTTGAPASAGEQGG
ncbi:hypothetical protein I5G61_gp61 [Mycobacterium phage Quesadilla]|uniref:Uncharacterized protein n=1 Tax=Mycobacterium phage Quesadilla TaxID=2664226 RepID=A0A5Q2WF44_9CAUD|nr:hypothetical protein I5G61_gp61 [Mycobacterium phage Quesadilla]QGH75309.1 hypothetical protein SEA_QUESADILLA_61 [Mycobacterium phage Quesadilla]